MRFRTFLKEQGIAAGVPALDRAPQDTATVAGIATSACNHGRVNECVLAPNERGCAWQQDHNGLRQSGSPCVMVAMISRANRSRAAGLISSIT